MTVGVQQTMYSVTESGGNQVVCVAVLSGRIAGRNVLINYETSDGSAEGGNNEHNHCYFCEYLLITSLWHYSYFTQQHRITIVKL